MANIIRGKVNKAALDQIRDNPDYAPWLPVFELCADGLIEFIEIQHKCGDFSSVIDEAPCNAVWYMADDTDHAEGPAGFDEKCLAKLLSKVKLGALIVGDPRSAPNNFYQAVAVAASLGTPGIIVDTRSEYEIEWHNLLDPKMPLLWLTYNQGNA